MTCLQVSQVVRYERAKWSRALDAAVAATLVDQPRSTKAQRSASHDGIHPPLRVRLHDAATTSTITVSDSLHCYSLQQLAFITAGLAAAQHPCQPQTVLALCQACVPKLAACVRHLQTLSDQNTPSADAAAAAAASLAATSGWEHGSRGRGNDMRPPASSPTAAATTDAVGGTAAVGTAVVETRTSVADDVAPPRGASLTLYPAACLALGLLRLRVVPALQNGDVKSGITTTHRAHEATVMEVVKLLGRWLKVCRWWWW